MAFKRVIPFAVVLCVCTSTLAAQELRIFHIDVEQGDATLFVSPAGNTLLVDSGRHGDGDRIKTVMDEAGVTQIDHFVATHYHADHYGGVDELIHEFDITIVNAFDRGDKEELEEADPPATRFAEYQNPVGADAEQLSAGDTISLDPDMTVTCVASNGAVLNEDDPTVGHDENDKSVALLISFGDFRYFIGGDIELTTEEKLASRDIVLDVDVYQANHHGSHTSSSLGFLQDLEPSVVVISNGNIKKFAHPRQSTLDRLAGLDDPPSVFQTNEFTRDNSLGGNVDDEFIADLVPSGKDGTILITVSSVSGEYVVSYADEEHTFDIKPRDSAGPDVVIESLLPDPVGSDFRLEEVTIRNDGNMAISLELWSLRDDDNHSVSLAPFGTLAAGTSLTIVRDGSKLSLNNDEDTITLFGPGSQVVDSFSYTGSQEGQLILTGS